MKSLVISTICIGLLITSGIIFGNYSDDTLHDLTNTLDEDIIANVESENWETATAVRVSPDLGYAKIYVSVFPFDKAQATLDVIEQQNRLIRGALGRRMRHQVKVIPELQFFVDDSLEYIENIDSLLKK